jgi:hypothetical protein
MTDVLMADAALRGRSAIRGRAETNRREHASRIGAEWTGFLFPDLGIGSIDIERHPDKNVRLGTVVIRPSRGAGMDSEGWV